MEDLGLNPIKKLKPRKASISWFVIGAHLTNLAGPITSKAYWLEQFLICSTSSGVTNNLNTPKGVSGNGVVIPRGEGGRKSCSGRALRVLVQGVVASNLMLVIGAGGAG